MVLRKILARLCVVALAISLAPVILNVTPATATALPSTVWTQLSPAATPSARTGASIAFDPATGNMVLFGGYDGTSYDNDTWTWGFPVNSGTGWTQVDDGSAPNCTWQCVNGPGDRAYAAMAYDPATGDTVLFGGANDLGGTGGLSNDTWIWNGSSWNQVCTSCISGSTEPSARFGASMAYDPATGQLLLVGGSTITNHPYDMWAWNGSTWTGIAASAPLPEDGASMAFDPATGQMLYFATDGTTWTWNGSTWTQLSPATSPPARSYASMAFDPATGNVVLFGGEYSSGDLSDTWTWNGSNWTQLFPAATPSERVGASIAFDPATGNMVLFGGTTGTNDNDTWTWNGSEWTQIDDIPRECKNSYTGNCTNSPPPTAFASMVYDLATGNMILFGGENDLSNGTYNDTWTFQPEVVAPGAPTGLNPKVGNQQIALSWQVPIDTGGGTIDGYDIYEGTTTGGESVTPVNSSLVTGTTATVTGLTNGTPYYFTVEAVNAAGNSPASIEVSATPYNVGGPVPYAPHGLSAAAGDQQVSLTWISPGTVEGYDVYEGTTSGGESTTPVNGATLITGTTYTVTGLTNGTPYYFTVEAVNLAGSSSASSEASATPVAPSYTVTFEANGGTGTMAAETDNTPTALTTNTFTRAGYTFSGWNTVALGGGTAYADGASYPFTANATLYAQWTANSYPAPSGPRNAPPPSGLPSSDFGAPSSVTVSCPASTTVAQSVGSESATVTVPAGALPCLSALSIYPIADTNVLVAMSPVGQSYVVSLAVSWLAPNGSSPLALTPLTMTISDPDIVVGDTIYVLTSSGLKAVGTATTNGVAMISFSNDPTFMLTHTNQVAQAALTVTRVTGTAGRTLTLTTSGGSGTGPVSYVVSNGTATSCVIVGDTLRATKSGTCVVTATKAADANYNSVSSEATSIFFRPALRAIRVTAAVWTGRTVVTGVLGTGFYGRPRVTSNAPGTRVTVLRVQGTRLRIEVTVSRSTRHGVHTFTIIFAHGDRVTVHYLQR